MKLKKVQNIEFLDLILSQGRKTFSFMDFFLFKHNVTNATRQSIKFMVKKKLVRALADNLYVILSPSERKMGKIQPDSFIDQLMSHKKLSYYVGLLSAASFYGAAHQRPLVFQVITNRQVLIPRKFLPDVEFHNKKRFPEYCITKEKGQFGYINYSSPALTVYDLIKFEKDAGTLYNIIPVISELIPHLKISDIKNLLKNKVEVAYIQRLGYILEKLRYSNVKPLFAVAQKATANIPLSRLEHRSGVINKKWRIIDNINWEDILVT